MPSPIKNNDSKRGILIGGAWLLTAVVCFGVGRASSWLESPVIPPPSAPVNATAGSAVNQTPGGADSRVGGIFAAEGTTTTGAVATVGEVTGGQPLEDWLKRLMAQDDDLFRMQNFMKLLESLDNPADIEAALKVVMASGGRGGRGPGGMGRFTEISMLMSKFVQLDPKAALTYSSALEGGEKFMATSTALRTWTRLSPDAALAWAQTEGSKITMDFGRGPGPGGEGEDGAPRENFALLGVVSQLAKTDLDKALTTAASMEIGRFGDRVVETLASEMVSQRGVDATRAYVDSLPAGKFRDEYLQQAAERLAGKDPAGTAKWVSGMESGDSKRRALGRTVDAWARNDFAAASSYVSSLPVGPDSDSARGEIVNVLTRQDPKKALEVATVISTPERRDRAIIQAGQQLMRTDPQNGPSIIAAIPNITQELMTEATKVRTDGGGGNGFRGGQRPGR
jgi:hypothetical protein